MNKLIGTFFYTGLLRPAPGTWGSLAALPFVWVFHELGGPLLLAAATLIAFYVGLWATRGLTAEMGEEDPSEIVIDEVVGMWLAMLPVSIATLHAETDILALYPAWISAFLAFRLFDIWKPWPVDEADKRGDAMGVMLDDVYAGIYAGLLTVVLAVAAHGFLIAS